VERSGFDGLHHQHALQNSSINERHSQEGLVRVFSGLGEVFEPGMRLHLIHSDRPHKFRHQASQPFMEPHAQGANTLRAQSERRRQYKVGPVRL
jgi:hypothetical protein